MANSRKKEIKVPTSTEYLASLVVKRHFNNMLIELDHLTKDNLKDRKK